jgi:ABC-type transporter Mla maintaining outer membrane lipid asymmetry ATPase subunit MlaF
MTMIETHGLCKAFGDHLVLDSIDLDVPMAERRGLPATTWRESLVRYVRRSASPASSQR